MAQKRNCENCAYTDRKTYEYPCDVCELLYDCSPTKWEPEDKPKTNADRIRKMTDEELAELFAGMCQSNVDGETHCYACLLNAWCPGCGYKDEWLEWLQQPYKEEKDG